MNNVDRQNTPCFYGKDTWDTAGSQVSLGEVLERIKNPDQNLASRVAKVREKHAALLGAEGKEDKKTAKQKKDLAKKNLPMFSPTVFKDNKATKADFLSASMLVLDIDHIEDPASKRGELAARPDILAAWVSPSGDGVKFIVVLDREITDAEEMARTFASIITEMGGDTEAGGAYRRTYLSVDPDIKINWLATTWPVEEYLKKLDMTEKDEGIIAHQNNSRPDEFKSTVNEEDDHKIILPSGNVSITKGAKDIFTRLGAQGRLYSRGGCPHEIVLNADGQELILEPVDEVSFCSRIEAAGKICSWRRAKTEDFVLGAAICKREDAARLLKTEEARTLLPPVRSLSQCPVMAVGKSNDIIVVGKGYSKECGGIFITGGLEPPRIPMDQAVLDLKSLLDGFNFQTAADRSRCLAMMVSPALKGGNVLDARFPIFVCEADQSQAGKGKLQSITASIYRSRLRMVVNKKGGVGSLDEELAAALIEGGPFITLDNIRGKIDSSFLEAVLTSSDISGGTVPCRIPHKPSVKVEAKPFNFMLTSNGMESTRDLANRCCFIRILKRPDDFVFKQYPEGNIIKHTLANQRHYLGCVFSVLAEWLSKGRPATAERRHDFQEWAASLDWIVQNIFCEAPLLDGHSQAKERASNPTLSWLRCVALAIAENGELDRPLTASNLVELCAAHGIPIPGSRDGATEDGERKTLGLVMSRLFKETDQLEVDGFLVVRGEQDVYRENHQDYKSVKTYTFNR